MERLTVFIDYQNVYHLARRAFSGTNASPAYGQIHPERAGELLLARRNLTYKSTPYESELAEVRAYRGMPDGALDPKGHGATSRQIAYWERHPDVRAFTHPIAYPRGWDNERDRQRLIRDGERPREKGIDVQIAVDMVLGAVQDAYDTAILFSGDSDLLPAIRAVLLIGKHVETAAWSPPNQPATRIPGRDLPPKRDGSLRSLWCHFLGEEDFTFMRDDTNYVLPSPS